MFEDVILKAREEDEGVRERKRQRVRERKKGRDEKV
jgi:hypothetical protein